MDYIPTEQLNVLNSASSEQIDLQELSIGSLQSLLTAFAIMIVDDYENDDYLLSLPDSRLGLIELLGKHTTTRALTDTVATISVIQHDELLRLNITPTPLSDPRVLRMADSKRVACTMSATIPFHLTDSDGKQHSFEHTFLVMPQLAMKCILGRDFFRAHNMYVGPTDLLIPGLETATGQLDNTRFTFDTPKDIASRVLSCFIGHIDHAPASFDDCEVYTIHAYPEEWSSDSNTLVCPQDPHHETYEQFDLLLERTDPRFHKLLSQRLQRVFPRSGC